MPKLTIKTPKMCRDRKQAYSQHKGKRYYHGVWGTPEALQKYKRFIAALMENPHLPQPDRKTGDLLVSELATGFLGYVEPRLDRTDFRHFKRAIGFLVEIYGAHTVNEFSPKKLKVCRSKMVGAGTLSRPYINKQIGRIIRVFAWGVEEEHVQPNTKSVGVPVFNVTKSQEKSKHSKGKRIWKLQNAEEAESEAEILYQDDPRDECLYTYSNHSKKSKSSRHSEGERYFIGNRDTSKYRQSTVKYPCCTPKYRQNAQDLIIIRTMVCWSVERLEGALRLERVFRRIGMSRFQTL